MAILLLSQGLPMILSGDEVLRSQQGNNNAWCQNNAVGWFDWGLLDNNRDMFEFTRAMIALRKRHASLRRRVFFNDEQPDRHQLPDIQWHGERLGQPPWDDPVCRVLCFTLAAVTASESHLHVVMNLSEAPHALELPAISGNHWTLAIDTAASSHSGQSFYEPGRPVQQTCCEVHPRSVLVFEGKPA
jgi:glycogen operon protein